MERLALELTVMPQFMPPKGGNVLLVGNEIFNLHYPFFYLESNVIAIDPLPKNRKTSIRGQFIVDRVVNIPKYLENNFIDLCQFNGVYGWGIDTESELRSSLISIHSVMKGGGILIFGHNLKTHNPLLLGNNAKTVKIFNDAGFDEIESVTLPIYLDNFCIRAVTRRADIKR
ncbi:MAG: hypothetical protein HY809_06895 [Nitrospirae bacterium]|nr:hypothetical protein [Nitrospirota bacterium]